MTVKISIHVLRPAVMNCQHYVLEQKSQAVERSSLAFQEYISQIRVLLLHFGSTSAEARSRSLQRLSEPAEATKLNFGGGNLRQFSIHSTEVSPPSIPHRRHLFSSVTCQKSSTMVATRHSLPSNAGDDETALETESRRVKNALKKLAVHGKGTLLGEKKPDQKENVTIYHHRGGSYAVTEATPKSWLDNQPARYKRQMSGMSDDGSGGTHRGEVAQIPSKKRARVTSFGEMDEPTPKRTRRSAPEAHNDTSFDDQDYLGEDTPRRTRRNLPDVYYGRPRRQPGDSDHNTPRKRRRTQAEDEEPISTSILYDYAVVGGRDEKSCQEAKRDHALFMGYEISPIENKFSVDYSENILARVVARCLTKLIQTNTKMGSLVQQYEDVNARLEAAKQRKIQNEVEKVADEVDAEILRAGMKSEPPAPSHQEPAVGTPRARSASPRAVHHPESIQEPTPPSQNSKESNHDPFLDDDDGEVAPPRHDSATDLTASALRRISTSGSNFNPSLPETNKAGNRLRWSLPPRVMEKERAEAYIFHGRLDGESRSARRRRVKRELKVIANWDDKTDTNSQLGPSEAPTFTNASQYGAEDDDSLYADRD